MLSNKGCALRAVIQLVGNAHPSNNRGLQQVHPRRTRNYYIRMGALQAGEDPAVYRKADAVPGTVLLYRASEHPELHPRRLWTISSARVGRSRI